MEREGMLEKNGWQNAPQYQQDRKLLEQDLNQSKELDTEKQRIAMLDDKAKSMFAQAQASDKSSLQNTQLSEAKGSQSLNSGNEAALRENARRQLLGHIKADPTGKVDVYFFFKPRDQRSIDMAPTIERLYQHTRKDSRVKVVGIPIVPLSDTDTKHFRDATDTSFPIVNVSTMAQALNLQTAPVTAFMGKGSEKVIFEEGPKDFFYLDELLGMLQGR
jgi:hypothetical protein